MGRPEDNARELVASAEKKLKSGFFASFVSNKFDDAAELFEKAAGQYKVAKMWKEAGDTYVRAGDCYRKGTESTSHNIYIEAAKCYKKCSPEGGKMADAIKMYRVAVEMCRENSRLSMAAKIFKTIAELCEAEHDVQGAIEAYSEAADCYNAEDSSASATSMLVMVAQLSAQLEDYKKAIEIYEQVAYSSLDNKMLKWNVKDYYVRASLCHLALAARSGEVDDVEAALEKYKDLYPAFDDTRELKFLTTVMETLKLGDVEKFTDAVYEFDNVCKLDTWKTSILLSVKNALKSVDIDDGADLI